jgi:hypothetical protein
MLFGTVLQMAYATNDMDRACALFGERYGVHNFLKTGAGAYPLDDGGELSMKVSHAWVGRTWLEIIEPVAGDGGLYSNWIPKQEFGLRLHHQGFVITDVAEWESAVAEAAAKGLRQVLGVTLPRARVRYFDTTADLGIYSEYLLSMDRGEGSLMAAIPQNVPGVQALW